MFADLQALVVAAGKAGGALLACNVSLHSAAHSDSCEASNVLPDLLYSPACLHRAAHSSRNVTGIAWATTDLPFATALEKQLPLQGSGQQSQQRQQQQQALLISVGADGRVRQWTVATHGSAPELVEADCPAAWSKPSLDKDAEFGPVGVAVSGNGLVMAVAVDNGTTAVAAVQYVSALLWCS